MEVVHGNVVHGRLVLEPSADTVGVDLVVKRVERTLGNTPSIGSGGDNSVAHGHVARPDTIALVVGSDLGTSGVGRYTHGE